MTNEEKAVIEAARALIQGVHPTSGLGLELQGALQAMDEAPALKRKFWINYHLSYPKGHSGEGHTTVTFSGQLTQERVQGWAKSLREQFGASVVIRTFTELEG